MSLDPPEEELEVPPDPKFCPRCGKPCKYETDQRNHPLDIHRCEDAECGACWDGWGEVQFWARTARAKPVRLGPTRGVKGMGS